MSTAPEDDDPEYRIAYDVDRCKVGCVLIQAALSCTVPNDLFFNHFGMADGWTVNATDCKMYPIRRSQLPMLAARTDFKRLGSRGTSRRGAELVLRPGEKPRRAR